MGLATKHWGTLELHLLGYKYRLPLKGTVLGDTLTPLLSTPRQQGCSSKTLPKFVNSPTLLPMLQMKNTQ